MASYKKRIDELEEASALSNNDYIIVDRPEKLNPVTEEKGVTERAKLSALGAFITGGTQYSVGTLTDDESKFTDNSTYTIADFIPAVARKFNAFVTALQTTGDLFQQIFTNISSITSSLNNKQATLVSGTNIKTINSTSLVGSGNIAVQPTLSSGSNIKTVDGQSIVGSGNIDVSKYATWITGDIQTGRYLRISNLGFGNWDPMNIKVSSSDGMTMIGFRTGESNVVNGALGVNYFGSAQVVENFGIYNSGSYKDSGSVVIKFGQQRWNVFVEVGGRGDKTKGITFNLTASGEDTGKITWCM